MTYDSNLPLFLKQLDFSRWTWRLLYTRSAPVLAPTDTFDFSNHFITFFQVNMQIESFICQSFISLKSSISSSVFDRLYQREMKSG